jgi:site-specific DNA-methyltransferase (adenine-specific)
MDIKNISVKDLIPYEKNTKKHDDVQINNVAESIKQYGFVQPIVIDKNNVVVIGHCRLLAAKKLKMADVPCVCVEDLTEEQVKALRIVDNKSNESPWDFEFLADELADLDLSDFDFDFDIDTDAEEEDFDENDLEREEEKDGGVLIQITFKTLQEYKNAEQSIKDIIGDATMTVKMV